MLNKLFFILIFTCLSLHSFAQSDWKKYTFKRAGFSINSPGEFEKKKSFLDTDIGKVDTYFYLYQPDQIEGKDHIAYVISYSDYPEGTIHSDSTAIVKSFFEVTVESSVETVSGDLVYENPTDYEGFPGWFWMLSVDEENMIIKSKTILVENRLYLIQVVTTKDLSLSNTIDDFISSFQLIDKQVFEIPPLKFNN